MDDDARLRPHGRRRPPPPELRSSTRITLPPPKSEILRVVQNPAAARRSCGGGGGGGNRPEIGERAKTLAYISSGERTFFDDVQRVRVDLNRVRTRVNGFIQDYLATLFFIGSSEFRRLFFLVRPDFIKVRRSKATQIYLETVLLSKPFFFGDLIMLKL